MGVSFTWRPVDPTEGISFAYGSTLHGYLEDAFGGFPIIFTDKDISKLSGMAACGNDDLNELIAAIGEHGKVEVQAHW